MLLNLTMEGCFGVTAETQATHVFCSVLNFNMLGFIGTKLGTDICTCLV